MKYAQESSAVSRTAMCLAASFCLASIAAGEDFIFIGFSFDNPNSWVNGAVPGESDTAIFGASAPFEQASFPNMPTVTDRVIIRNTQIEFLLGSFGNAYTLLNPMLTEPAIVVGEQFGDTAELRLWSGPLHGPHMMIGQGLGADGTVVVGDDVFSHLIVDGYLAIGQHGAGELHHMKGIVETNLTTLGAHLGSSGVAIVEGELASWTNLSTLTVGKFGDGSLTVRDGATLDTGQVIVAQHGEASASIIVEDPDSILTINGRLDIGMIGNGGMQVRNGASVTVANACTMGAFAEFVLHGQLIDITDVATGDLIVTGAGSSLQCAGDLYVGFVGHASAMVKDGAIIEAPAIFVGDGWSSGNSTLGGDGTIVGDVLGYLETGTLLPGAPIGELTIDGNLDGLAIEVQIAGAAAGEFDQLVVTQEARVSGATLLVDVEQSYVPSPGDSFEIISAGVVIGEFGAVSGLPGDWDITYSAGSVTLAAPGSHPADLDNSGEVDAADLAIVLGNWGVCDDPEDCPADLDGDGVVGAADLAIVLGNWGPVT